MSASTTTKILPWGEEIYLELPIYKAASKFYARHGKTTAGKEYIEFAKFGSKPNMPGETYSQKFRLYNAKHWAAIKHYVEENLSASIGWDLTQAEQEFEAEQLKQDQPAPKE
jgi:hypothetical protein